MIIHLRKLFGLCIMLLLVAGIVAAQSNYPAEATVVGRIVGDTPGELEQQLLLKELNLKHATYVLPNVGAGKSKAVVSAQFPYSFSKIFGDWDWNSDVTDASNKFENQEYFILERKSGDSTSNHKLTLENAKSWAGSFRGNKPLFVFSTEYGGVYLPKQESFMSILGQDSVTVTTNAYYSSQFTKSFICNLAGPQTIGEAFRNARNDYYSGAHNDHFLFWRTHGESVGLPLYSYLLYGNPQAKISLPDKGEEKVKKYCEEFPFEIRGNAETTIQVLSSESSINKGSYVFTVENWTVQDVDGYGILAADNMESAYEPFELVLPSKVLKHEFPLKTVITNVSLVSFWAPVELTIPNLPSWENGLVNRSCYYEQKNAGMGFAHLSEDDKESVMVEIFPVEVVDCANGKLKLYTKVTYNIDFIPFSPVLIKDVAAPSGAFPGQSVSVNVSLKNLQGAAFEGELVLSIVNSSGGKEHVAEKKVVFAAEQQETTAELTFTAPTEEGIRSYRLEFVEDGAAKTFHDFSISVKALELSFEVPVTAGESGEATLTVTNNLAAPVDTIISSYLLKDGETTTTIQEKSLVPGSNEVKVSYEGLKREDASYSILATVNYGSSKETAAATLTTNHPPLLEPLADVTVTEGEKVVLSPAAADVDGDEVQIAYSGKMEGSEWQTQVGDAGSYEVTITASDGLLDDTQTIKVTVLEDKDVDNDGFEKDVDCDDSSSAVNPAAAETCNNVDDNCSGEVDEGLQDANNDGECDSPLVLAVTGNQIVKENETLTIALSAYDFNGDKLTFSSSQLPKGASLSDDGVFTWTPTFEQAGQYYIGLTASDELLKSSGTLDITVMNVNRPPQLKLVAEPSGSEIKMGEFKLLMVQAADPDDDTLYYTWLHNGKLVSKSSFYKFTPTADDGALNEFSVTVSDGEAEVKAQTALTFINTMECAPGLKRPCPSQQGTCKGSMETCSSEGKWPGCTEATYSGHSGSYQQPETSCDNLDNDCDGSVDDDLVKSCSSSGGISKCAKGAWEPCSGTGEPVKEPPKEICGNKIDDNGNGQVDEGCDTTPPSTMVYLSESSDPSLRHDYTYSFTIYAHVTNWEQESEVSFCEVNWNDGIGWEAVSKGTPKQISTFSHVYKKVGAKKVEYRCASQGGISGTSERFAGHDVIDIRDGTPPATKVYLGDTQTPAKKKETTSLKVYAYLWNWDSESDVTKCEIDWDSGWEEAPVGPRSLTSFYVVAHDYQQKGAKRVNYRCTSEFGGTNAGDSENFNYAVITIN